MDTLLVTDVPNALTFASSFTKIVSAMDYLLDPQYTNETSLRIINLCESYQYQTTGYYVSLLAEARGHKVIPSVLTIQDTKNKALASILSESISDHLEEALKNIRSPEFILSVYFGKNMAKRYAKISQKLHGLFPMPLFRVHLKRRKTWYIHRIETLSADSIPATQQDFFIQVAKEYFAKKRFRFHRKPHHYYEMAILCNPKEKTPPSNPRAIKKFIAAAEAVGIRAEVIEKDDFKTIGEYDALFIRETTAVNHHTYRFARRAFSEHLVVIDDPESILKCTNKVYLAELLHKHHINAPYTHILGKQNWKTLKAQLEFPCVLKKPDSSFSQGVIKVNEPSELDSKIKEFFKTSDLVIAQSFVPSDYDWRIGILDHKPLYACRCYMAQNHWQIYNWQSKQESTQTGDLESVAIENVPPKVLQTALKVTKLIGDGFYGVDLKEINNKVYVIEVNDNPSIDSGPGYEDELLGDQLYLMIMKVFLARLKKLRGNI